MFRNPRWMGRWIVIAITIVLLCSLQALAKKPPKPGEDPPYMIIPFMRVESTSTTSSVTNINEQGQAVGFLKYADGSYEAVHYDIDSKFFTTLSGGREAYSVNNLNQIVGLDEVSGVFWSSPTASPISLPPLPDDLDCLPLMINDAGIICGVSRGLENDLPTQAAVVWRVYLDGDENLQVDGPKLLPPLSESAEWCHDVNEVVNGAAQAVGRSDGDAVIWTVEVNANGTLAQPGIATSLGILSDLGVPQSTAIAIGMNNLADVCGLADGDPFVAFLGQEAQFLPLPRKATEGKARGINDQGDIVGHSTEWTKFYPGRQTAQLWRDGQRIDLATQIPDDSGWERLHSAWCITSDCVIAGHGTFDVTNRGFIMIPNTQ